MKRSIIIKSIICLFAGALAVCAFAPFYLPWLAPIALLPLLFCLRKSSRLQAFFFGLIFGVGFFGLGASWIYISIHRFGGTNVLIASIITGLFVLVLSLFIACQTYIFTVVFKTDKNYKWLLGFPASWALFEWIRSWALTGFPWLLLGYSQTNACLKGYASIVGTYGVSFLVVLTATLIFLIFVRPWKYKIYFVISLIAIWFLGFGLTYIHWTKPTGNSLSVSLIQGNIPQQMKWDENSMKMSLDRYLNLTKTQWKNDLIIWPEAAVPLPLPQAKSYIDSLDQLARKNKISIILGIPIQASDTSYYNSAIAIGESSGEYDKQHLVPFGEYVPFEKILRGLIQFFDLPMSSFIPNPHTTKWLIVKNIPIAPFICYEIAYENLVWKALPKAQILLTITNDAWFGKSFASMQHLQIGQMRSIESGRYTLFVGNSGITAIIAPAGCLSAAIQSFQTNVLHGKVYAMTGSTPWTLYGSWPIIILLFIFILVGFKFR